MDSESGEIVKAPLREFRGWLKCQRPHHTNVLGKLVTSTSFPLFDSNKSEDFVTDVDKMAKEQVRQQIIEEFPGAEESFINSVLRTRYIDWLPAVRYRRFAGDSQGLLSLERGRYYTVCVNEVGFDYGTLANEFNSYCNTLETGFALAVDHAGSESPKSEIAIFLNDLQGAPSLALKEARSQGLLPDDADSVRVDIPYDVSEISIERVLDLRYPDARHWLFEQFGAGKPGVLEREAEPPPPEATFLDMLPWMMVRDNGGDKVTNKIGAYLRTIGIDALVFPSARSDVFVEFNNGEMIDFGGWNLVDYRNAETPPLDEVVRVLGDWVGFRDRGDQGLVDLTTLISIPDENSEFDGSFRVIGNQSHHLLLLHIHLCFQIWNKLGYDAPVSAYRWHSTQAYERSEGLIIIATCQQCNEESPELVSIEDFHMIPGACPRCGYSTPDIL